MLQLEYDNKYSVLVEKCLLEADEEICVDNSARPDSASFTMNKMANPDLEIDLEELGNGGGSEAQNNNFRSIAKAFGRSEIDVTGQTYGELDDKNNGKYAAEEISLAQRDSIQKRDILCSQCHTVCETREIFEDHKMFCDKKENTSKHITMSGGLQDKKDRNMAVNVELETESSRTGNKQLTVKPEVCESMQSIPRPACSELFKAQQDLDKHKRLHENITENAATAVRRGCGYCKEFYHSKKDLLNHIVQSHEGQLLFRCCTCDKTYEKWSSLDIHEATHRFDKPYLCDLCGKSFKHSNYLRGHKRTHLDESRKKRHVCEICEKAFRSR